MPPIVSTGGWNAVAQQVRQCTAVQTLVNCHCQLEKHPVRDVKPVEFVVQYLTQATVKLAAAFNTRCNLSVTVLGVTGVMAVTHCARYITAIYGRYAP